MGPCGRCEQSVGSVHQCDICECHSVEEPLEKRGMDQQYAVRIAIELQNQGRRTTIHYVNRRWQTTIQIALLVRIIYVLVLFIAELAALSPQWLKGGNPANAPPLTRAAMRKATFDRVLKNAMGVDENDFLLFNTGTNLIPDLLTLTDAHIDQLALMMTET